MGGGNPRGWGVPMATDTAFAVGILALLKARIPTSLVLFVTALAIIDDIGAMLIIALAYTEDVKLLPLARALAAFNLLMFVNWLEVRRAWPYLLGGIWMWFELHAAGIHTTLAGVLVAATVPARSEMSPRRFLRKVPQTLNKFSYLNRKKNNLDTLSDDEQHQAVTEVASQAERAVTPLRRWEHLFEKPITLLVMPLFALANAGITFETGFFTKLISNGAALGIFAGLVFGKAIGIVIMTAVALRLGWGKLPPEVTLRHIVGVGLLAGIGFTMSILIATLAFGEQTDDLMIAKSAVLLASLTAGVIGYCWLRWFMPSIEEN
jgi:NhaA family Na+:H+ antiporter